ncbi:MAG: FAD-binding protein, partial [Caldilineaceae bacterium]|nr:FAD-binding protein [Caldilineaceae bacterium]
MHADSIEAIQEILHHGGRFVVRSGGSKTALSTPYDGETILDLSAMAGILEYAPGEFTFTARAATPLATVRSALAEHGQYLPFDPPLVAQGATLGGTVAAGLSGPGRHRYGGVRDFLIGIRFVDGQGRLVRGGGKVVKNAAGFDLPKLFVGSLGRLGVLVELSFKVFPQPLRYATLHLALPALDAALDTVARLTSSSYDIEALDLTFDTHGEPHCHIRLGGLETTLPGRLRELQTWLGAGIEVEGDVEATFWEEALSFSWLPAGWNLVKIPVTLADIPPLEAALADTDAIRRY